MGDSIDRYLQHDAAGDQVCGRTVAGLDVASFCYSVSPPHFVIMGPNDAKIGKELTTMCTVEDVDQKIIEVFGTIPDNWKLLCWYLLETLLYHKKTLLQ
jgi:hypothetical protein